ncbi:hypothetical protein AVEN_222592-1 [Araneus ventricosus]|uniref:Uncharacterized protein n=1 Tax=Araneus ventricosus TaxID=182803 RepID=A0A4Y2KVP2_ARAVE|nr:hypothetical protein AVEN_222592-1 [Araneus ventricosus]
MWMNVEYVNADENGYTVEPDKGIATEENGINEGIRNALQRKDLYDALNILGHFYSSSNSSVPEIATSH